MQPVDVNGEPVDRRQATAIGSTAGIPTGTLVTVPVAPPTGPTPAAPVVAVETKKWWKSWEIWLSAVGLPVLDVVAEQLLPLLKVNGDAHHVAVLALGIYIALRRKNQNTVIR